MHDIVTKETWSSDPDNAPLPSDFNRIESNTRKVEENRAEIDDDLQDHIDAEEAARIAAVDAEETARDLAIYNISTKSNDANLLDYPVNTVLSVKCYAVLPKRNDTMNVYLYGTLGFSNVESDGLLLIGVWKCRGYIGLTTDLPARNCFLAQRIS